MVDSYREHMYSFVIHLNFKGVQMPMNKVQFQKSLSLPELFEKFGTEEQCFKAAFERKWP
jgi:hypothetical protein